MPHAQTIDSELVTAAAERLTAAAETGVPCTPVRELIGIDDVSVAYAVQQQLTRARLAAGARVVGHKIGLTSPAVQQQLGVDQPDFGVLFDDMDVTTGGEGSGGVVPAGRLIQPKVEAEIAFVLGADLDDPDLDDPDLGPAIVRAAVDHQMAAIEVVDSRVEAWDIRITDTVADNASSGLFVLGDQRRSLAEVEPADTTMRLYRNDDLVSEGTGAGCLGDPLHALLWLARTARTLGDPLRSGQVVLSGALGPMVPALPGDVVRAEISGLGTVAVTFANKE
jgi:2-keto-4-pentenoate hydratase